MISSLSQFLGLDNHYYLYTSIAKTYIIKVVVKNRFLTLVGTFKSVEIIKCSSDPKLNLSDCLSL